MEIELQLSSTDLSDDELDALARQLANTITDETDVAAALQEGDSEPGAKGDPITIGSLVLTFISSGAAIALFEVFKTYFARESSLNIALKRSDGTEVSVSAQNLKPEQLQGTIDQVKQLADSD